MRHLVSSTLAALAAALVACTHGGTGGPRDTAPEATADAGDADAPGQRDDGPGEIPDSPEDLGAPDGTPGDAVPPDDVPLGDSGGDSGGDPGGDAAGDPGAAQDAEPDRPGEADADVIDAPAPSETAVSAGQAAVVEWRDPATGDLRIRVEVPAGAITAPGLLSVSPADYDPPGGEGVGVRAAGFSVRLTGQPENQALPVPATLTFHFDPARLRADVPPAEAAWTLALDSVTGLVEEPCTVDAALGTATVQAVHFSDWWLYLMGPGDVHGTSEHFTFRFPANIDVAAWGTIDVYEVMAKVRSRVGTYFDAYVGAGFTPPDRKIPVQLKETDEPAYDPLSGRIVLSSRVYSDRTEVLEQELAHEVFHAFQGKVRNLFHLHQRRWFVEAAADYAADRIAARTGILGEGMDVYWSSAPLGTVGGRHEYASAHFIAWLVDRGKSFKGLQDAVLTAPLADDHGEAAFAAAAALSGDGFVATFMDFLIWLETDVESPLSSEPVPAGPVSSGFEDNVPVDFPGFATPRLFPYVFVLPAGEPRGVRWTIPPTVKSEVRILRGGLRTAVEVPADGTAEVHKDDVLLILALSEKAQQGMVGLKVDPDAVYTYVDPVEYSGTIPHTFDRSQAVCRAGFHIAAPWGTEVVVVSRAACAPSLSGRVPSACAAWEAQVRSTLPGKDLTLQLSLGGVPSPDHDGTPMFWQVFEGPTVLQGESYPRTVPSLPPVKVPASGGRVDAWQVLQVIQQEVDQLPVEYWETGCEFQLHVTDVTTPPP